VLTATVIEETTPEATANALVLIAADMKSAGIDMSHPHPSIIPAIAAYTPQYSSAIEQEHARLQADPTSKLSAIDLKRYEDLEAPPNTTPTSDEDRPELLARWNDALNRAHTSSGYVQSRLTELGLLEKFGKNQWLVGNAQSEDILKALEAELAVITKEKADVHQTRQTQQESVAGELKILEETWSAGVGKVLQTQVAAEALKQQILERRRAGAV
jgi:pre-mRNA-splicing factor SPF27